MPNFGYQFGIQSNWDLGSRCKDPGPRTKDKNQGLLSLIHINEGRKVTHPETLDQVPRASDIGPLVLEMWIHWGRDLSLKKYQTYIVWTLKQTKKFLN